MSLLIRIDVDRPFGKRDFFHQLISRIGSDYYFPPIRHFHYLDDLKAILKLLNQYNAASYVFFRRCTFPSASVHQLMLEGRHIYGLHLENSRTFQTFCNERERLEKALGKSIKALSKHGSGVNKYGWHHYAPYEPEKYIEWANTAGIRMFFGNLEDPTLPHYTTKQNVVVCPAAFWLEPHWRDVKRFTKEWLCKEVGQRDIVLLLHADNVTADAHIMEDFIYILERVKTKTMKPR